jgi:hypothetical protein
MPPNSTTVREEIDQAGFDDLEVMRVFPSASSSAKAPARFKALGPLGTPLGRSRPVKPQPGTQPADSEIASPAAKGASAKVKAQKKQVIAKAAGARKDTNPKGAGRRKENPCLRATMELRAFGAIPDDHTESSFRRYFGEEHKTKHRALVALAGKFEEFINECDDVEELVVLQEDKKRVEGMTSIASAFVRSAYQASSAFMQEFNTVQGFLKLVPAVEIVWPSCIRKVVFEQSLTACSYAEFWTFVKRDCMETNGFDASSIDSHQMRIVADRFLGMTEGSDDQKYMSNLAGYCSALPCVDLQSPTDYNTNLRDQLLSCSAIEDASNCPLETLELALTNANDASKEVLGTLSMSMAGRKLLATAQHTREARLKFTGCAMKISKSNGKVSLLLQGDGHHPHDMLRLAANTLHPVQILLAPSNAIPPPYSCLIWEGNPCFETS